MKNAMHVLFIFVVINLLLHTDGAEIRGSSDNAIQGQNFTLICSFTTTPQIGVIFKRKLTTDDKSLDYFSFSLTGGNCVGSGTSSGDTESCTTSELCTCNDDRKLFSVYISSVPSSWHNSEWTCGGAISTPSSVLMLFVTDGTKIRGSLNNAVQGQNFTFICSFLTTPQIGVIFKRKLTTDDKSDAFFSFSLTGGNCIGSGTSSGDTESCTTSELCTCSDDRKLFSVYIPSVPSSWHNSEWSCGGLISTPSPVLKFFVTVPFTKAEITPAGDLVTNISRPVNAVCTSSPGSRPQADITWTLRKTDGTAIDITGSSTQVTDPNDSDPDTVKTTRSTLTYTPTDKSYNGASIYCKATSNRTPTQTSQERRLVVQYAPEGSLLLVNNITGQLTEGMSLGLTCQMSGGNPMATLSWSCKGQPLTSINRSAGNVARWELQIMIDRSYDGTSCVCTGTHPLWNDSKSVTLSILYPPSGTPGLTTTPQKPFYLVNDSVTLTCKSPSTSNPAATITWSCKGQDVTSSASNGNVGNSGESSLVIKVDSGYNGQLCACIVSHPVNNYRRSVSITFNIHFTTEEPLILSTSPSYVYRGDDVLILCSMKGGNPLSVITLSCGATQGVDNSSTDTSSRLINLKSITNEINNQTCVCTATHKDYAAFKQKKELKLIVYYFPDLPSGLTFESVTANSVLVSWTAGENNGYGQTFHLSYQTKDSYKLTIDIPEERNKAVYTVQVKNLDPDTTYSLQLMASNARGSNFNFLSRNVTTKEISEKTKCLIDEPSTTSIALVAVSGVLFLSTVIASVINVLYFIKRRRQKSNDTGIREDIQEMKPQSSVLSPNVYEDLGERNKPAESHYLHLQQRVSSDVKSNQGTLEHYDELMTRDPPSQYDQIQVDRCDKDYENTDVT